MGDIKEFPKARPGAFVLFDSSLVLVAAQYFAHVRGDPATGTRLLSKVQQTGMVETSVPFYLHDSELVDRLSELTNPGVFKKAVECFAEIGYRGVGNA